MPAPTLHELLFLIPGKLSRPFFAELCCECENSIYDRFGDRLRPIWRCVPRQSDEFNEKTVVMVLRREMRQTNAIRLLITVPTSSKQIAVGVADVAKERNIPVVALTLPFHFPSVFRKRKLQVPPVVLCDSAQGTRELGKAASLELRRLRPGMLAPTVVLIPGEARRMDSIARLKGFSQGMQESGLRPEFVISSPCNWQRLAARAEMQRLIQESSATLDVVFAGNDEMALGARDAILATAGSSGSRLVGNTIVYGFDATNDACSLIRENDSYLKGTIKQNLPEMAEALAELIDQILKGKKLGSKHVVAIKPTIVLPESTKGRLDLVRCWPNIPPLNLGSGQWATEKEAADIERIGTAALRDYRKACQGCKRAEGGTIGLDRFGRMWRRDRKLGRAYYLRATLVKLTR